MPAAAQQYEHLMSPGVIGGVTIRNRIVQAPMGTGLMRDGHVTDGDIAFMEGRARGGVGLSSRAPAPCMRPPSSPGGS